jgi:chaperonin GroES
VLTFLIKKNKRSKKMGKLKLNPLADRVIVRPNEAEEKTKGGIILPDTAKEKPVEGTVVATGPGKVADDGKPVKMEVKVGDKVLYGKYSGTEVAIDGEEYLIMRESDIFAIIG